MQKRNLKVLFCVILLISFISPSVISDLAPPLEMMTTSFSPTPVAASEEENVDSFNVHPANRWSEILSSFTGEVVNGMLNMSDIGDGTKDYAIYDRDLRALDGKIEIKFCSNTNGTGSNNDNTLYFMIFGGEVADTNYIYLRVSNIRDGLNSTTTLSYMDVNNVVQTKTLTGSEQIWEGHWYILKIEYNLLKSTTTFKVHYYDNNTRVFSHTIQDIGSIGVELFQSETIGVRIRGGSRYDTQYIEHLVDYVKAPFKEREWVQVNSPTDTDYKSDSWSGAYCYDDIDDQSTWRLNVPYFDSASGKMVIDCNEESVLTTGDFDFYIRLYAVDGDDGDLHEIFEIRLYLWAAWNIYASVYVDTNTLVDTFFLMSLTTDEPESTIDWSIVLSNDRTEAFLQTRMTLNGGDGEFSIPANCTISNAATDPSTEFVLEVDYLPDFDEDVEFTASLEGFTLSTRDIFADILQPVVEGIMGLLGEIFILIGRFIASIFKIVGDLIVIAVDALQPLLTAISAAIVAMQSALDSAIGLVQNAVDGLVTWIQAVAGDILALIGDFIDDGITHILTIIATIVGVLATIAFAIYDGLFVTVFGFAEAPDLLALMYQLGVGAIQLVIGLIAFIPAFATNLFRLFDLIPAIGLFCFLVLPLLQSDSLGGFFSNALHNMAFDISFDFRPFGLGFHIPVVIPWLLISMATVFSDTIYAGFF